MVNIKLVLRNLFKIKSHTLLNITGLGISFACVFAVIVWVKAELSYDHHLPSSDRLYRLTFETNNAGNRIHFARCYEKWIGQMPEAFPQIEEMVRLSPYRHTALKIGENEFYSDKVFATDTNFFKVFNTDMISGDPVTALSEPYAAVISSSLAEKYFGTEYPIGRSIMLSGEYDTKMIQFTVKGVMRDAPPNSHIHFDIVTSYVRPEEAPDWAYVYILLKPNTNSGEIISQFPRFLKDVVKENDKADYTPFLQPVTDIHLFSDKDREAERNGSITSIYLFILISLVLLLVSWTNYYNLSKVKLLTQLKQIQVQCISGSNSKLIILQSFIESSISVGIAVLVAILLLDLTKPYLQSLTGYKLLTGHLTGLSSIIPVILLFIIMSILAGSIPLIAHVLKKRTSLMNPEKSNYSSDRLWSTYGILMTFQFIMAIILIVATITINKQKEYIFSRSLGEMSSDILVFKKQNWEIRFKYDAFRKSALQNPLIKDISAVIEEPSGETVDALTVESQAIDKNLGEIRLYVLPVEDNFLDFFKIKLIAGRNFSKFNPNRKGEDYILNETALKRLGWTPEEAIGKPFKIGFETPDIFYGGTVVGVVSDFNFNTLKQTIKPFALFQKPIFYLCFLVKVDHERKAEAISGLKKIWEEELPDYPFQYEFINDLYRSTYAKELTQARLTGFFSILAILIICFGLFSITSLLVARRTKEIGIRKVNGAKLTDILSMLNSDFLKWLGVAYIIATPAAWFIMNRWLRSFEYRTDISWWIFILTGLLVLIISLATVTIQSWRAAARNPVEALRYE